LLRLLLRLPKQTRHRDLRRATWLRWRLSLLHVLLDFCLFHAQKLLLPSQQQHLLLARLRLVSLRLRLHLSLTRQHRQNLLRRRSWRDLSAEHIQRVFIERLCWLLKHHRWALRRSRCSRQPRRLRRAAHAGERRSETRQDFGWYALITEQAQ
jgi:hypothetical protein